MHSSTTNKVNAANLDEFRYGFPSDGLSSVSYKWWENNNTSTTEGSSESQQNNNSKERDQEIEGDHSSSTNNEPSQWAATSYLSFLRKRAAEDGRRALKRRRYGFKNFDWSKNDALMKIFKTSLPAGDLIS